ncbi:peptidase M20 [Gemmatirosa kalamazoonensis]|uniref:Peptidase M20 n=1 Tax=Gemmatirosa kalamazoonensis TaxID=861299 RepID=W0RIR6_9BACT|nr:M20/M25/M40 family metallo-hydrolase [Gemmatirosa kalamazoonensis]AHG89293.1 peptidase M20 [Gemmatirosa kalamazoonensis]
MRLRPLALLAALTVARIAAAQTPGARARAAAETYRDAHEGTILREFSDLLALPNVARDSADIRRNADFLLAMLGKRGFTNTRLLTVPGGPPAVYGELPSPGATRTLVLYAHYDGQPLDPKQWTSPPWQPVLRDREPKDGGKVIALPNDGQHADPQARLYARSAGDDKASIMAMLAAVDAMRAAGTAPSVNLKVFFEGEEEAGSAHLRQILETYRSQLTGDGWLFCDGPVHQSGRQQVVFGQRGVTEAELTVYGPTRALHSGHYGNWAPNPGVMLANLIASMRDDDGRIKIAGYYDDVRPITPAERRAIAALPAYDDTLRRALGLGRTEANGAPLAERLMLPALNLRGIRVGGVRETGSNTIATEAYASFDLRLVPNQTPERVQRLFEAHLARQGWFVTHDSATTAVRLAHPKVVRVQWGSGYPASRAPMDGPFGRAVIAALRDGAAEPPLVIPTTGGSGPAYLFEQVLKVPMISLPIANFDDNQHAADENLKLKNLWDGIETYAALLAGMGKTWGAAVTP